MRIVAEGVNGPVETRGRKPKYKWNEWLLHGKTVELREGEDFTCRQGSIRQQAYNRAQDMHGKVITSAREEDGKWVVSLTFYKGGTDVCEGPETIPLGSKPNIEVELDDELLYGIGSSPGPSIDDRYTNYRPLGPAAEEEVD